MLAELTAINSAYAVIKEVINNGRELGECAGHLGKFFESKLKLEKKVVQAPANERNQLEEFFALEEARRKEKELKDYMLIAGRPGLWDDWVKFQKMYAQRELAIAQAQKRAEIEAAQQREELVLASCILILFSIFVAIIFGFVYVITRIS
jgi:hypothetical protein